MGSVSREEMIAAARVLMQSHTDRAAFVRDVVQAHPESKLAAQIARWLWDSTHGET